jgi:hypothetical protein
VTEALRERFRGILVNALENMTGERWREVLRHTALRSVIERRRDNDGGRQDRSDDTDALDDRLRRHVGERIRERITDGLRDRLDFAIREGVEECIRERLSGAIRRALAEERAYDRFDGTRLAEAIRYELADSLRLRVDDSVRHRIAESLRTRLSEAIESGVTQAHAGLI